MPLLSTFSFHSFSLLISSSSVSAITARSSAYSSSHGRATLSTWKYLKILEKSLNLNLAKFEILHWLTVLKQALVCLSPVLGNSIWFHFACLLALPKFSLCIMYSKFWMSASRIWLFVDNFVSWKMQFGSLKVLEKCLNFVLWVCYEPWGSSCSIAERRVPELILVLGSQRYDTIRYEMLF